MGPISSKREHVGKDLEDDEDDDVAVIVVGAEVLDVEDAEALEGRLEDGVLRQFKTGSDLDGLRRCGMD